jgi:long-chain-fatty-acid--CoA ligase ACSBG
VYFADPSALQGTLIQTLQEVRPTVFFSVPRVWEKIYDKMQEIAQSNSAFKTKLGI